MPKSFAYPFGGALRLMLAAMAVTVSSLSAAEPLRVCSDPDNLPFSKADGPDRGLYIELAELVGKRLGTPVEYVWHLTFNQRRALRNTLGSCDAYFALPAGADYKVSGVTRTRPFLDVGYVIVSEHPTPMDSLSDLKGRRIGVTFGSSAQVVLSNLEGYEVRGFRDAGSVYAAMAAGEIDVAVVWGPHAGYLNLTELGNRWKLTPVSGLGLSGRVAVAVPKGKDALREKIDAALGELQPEIDQLQRKYGFPRGVPLVFEEKTSWRNLSRQIATGQIDLADAAEAMPTRAGMRPLARGDNDDFRRYLRKVNDVDINEYRAVFNSRCAHCHSQNGASPQPERDLRRLSSRYDEKWKEVARKTIHEGRSDYGMPAWGASLSAAEIENLITYLETIQRKR